MTAPRSPRPLLGRFANFIRERRARKRLAEIVASTRASFECQDYARRRKAALKGLGRA